MQLVIKVYLFKIPYTVCFISEDSITLPDECICRSIGVRADNDGCRIKDQKKESSRKILKVYSSALFLQPFVKECLNSDVYRTNVLRNLSELCSHPDSRTVFLKLILEPPDREVIDYAWNTRMLQLIWTRVEVENAFSWLSTLGGAYSALGDYFEHCAEEAGRISIRQYKLSKMLGDDGLAARSRLYSALAFSQKGHLRLARRIVRNVASFARQTHDRRLNRMCQGVWAKLKYLKNVKSSKMELTCANGTVNSVVC
ncbi:uncharacterized protein LOC112056964 [Bicyclus anynana]|uniref:Uncharacterized protein LOC112056964 n=1 Tax=Bicyclus anynana TaxID=110368 RepID=A0ABM3LIB6_BICAN|nr:uncharacterized protein LOC112056964 [Bicyclus anynana]